MSEEYVIVPKEDYVDTCDAIREKKNTTELIKSGEMAQAVRDIQSGDDGLAIGLIQGDLTEVNIPKGTTSVGQYAFYKNTKIKSVTLPGGLTTIGNWTFADCTNLMIVKFPDDLKTIWTQSFVNCTQLTNVILPNSIVTIDNAAFARCSNLTNITIPENVVRLGNYAFENCTSLTKVNINMGLTTQFPSWGTGIFKGCKNIQEIHFGSKYEFLPKQMFSGAEALEELVLPDTVLKLGNRCFENCINLRKVYISKSLTEIEQTPFLNCTSLEEVTLGEGFNCNGLDLSSSDKYSRETIVSWFKALANRIGLETYTLTIGATNLAKLTEEDIAIATNKNWTVA